MGAQVGLILKRYHDWSKLIDLQKKFLLELVILSVIWCLYIILGSDGNDSNCTFACSLRTGSSWSWPFRAGMWVWFLMRNWFHIKHQEYKYEIYFYQVMPSTVSFYHGQYKIYCLDHRVMNISSSKLSIIGFDNGWSPVGIKRLLYPMLTSSELDLYEQISGKFKSTYNFNNQTIKRFFWENPRLDVLKFLYNRSIGHWPQPIHGTT